MTSADHQPPLPPAEQPATPPRAKRWGWGAILTYGFSILCLAALVWLAGQGSLDRLASPSWSWLAIAFGLTILIAQTTSAKLLILLDSLGIKPRPDQLSTLYSVSFGLTSGLFLTAGMGQLLGTPTLLKTQEGLPMTKGVYASLLERLLDVVLSLPLLLPIFLRITWKQEPFSGFYLVLCGVIALLWGLAAAWRLGALLAGVHYIFSKVLHCLAGWRFLPNRRLNRWLEQGAWQELEGSDSVRGQAGLAFWSIMKIVVLSLRNYCLALAFALPISWESLLLGVPVLRLTLLASFTPGSLGLLEAGWLAVLVLQGVPLEVVLTYLLAMRLTTYIFYPLMTVLLRAAHLIRRGRQAA